MLLCAGCDSGNEQGSGAGEGPGKGGRPVVVAVNYPIAWFVERLAGDRVVLEYPVPPDQDPAYWQPSPEEVSRIQEADLILLNGAGYARWVEVATLPASRTVNTSAAFRDHYIEVENGVTHSHGPEGVHSHGETAFTTWLDFQQAQAQARAVHEALAGLVPEARTQLQTRLAEVVGELQALDQAMQEWAGNWGPQPLLASHPVYQYLARRYDLNVSSLHWEPDRLPEDEAWIELGTVLKRHPARWMLWEEEPLPGTRDRLTGLGVGVVVFNPCANHPESGDFLSVMQANVERLTSRLEPK